VAIEAEYTNRKSEYLDRTTTTSIKVVGATTINGDEQSFSRLGLGLLTGFDVQLIKRLYIGAELGYSFSKTKFTEMEFTIGSTTSIIPESSSFSYGPSILRTIRLGYFF